MEHDETSPRYAGWRVVLACFLVAMFIFGFGLYGHGVYVAEFQRLRGWPADLVSGASTLTFLLSAIFAMFTHELLEKFGISASHVVDAVKRLIAGHN